MEFDMNTLYLKYAVEVESTGSISRAADNLFMAQPNLSKAIKELEAELGIAIFERTSKGVVPTTKGAEFLSCAKNVLLQLDRMESLSRTDNGDIQHFSVSIPRGSYISDGVTRFVAALDSSKGIDVTVNETNSMQTITDISEDRYRLGIIRYKLSFESYFMDYLEEKKLCCMPLWEFENVVLMSAESSLAQTKILKASALSGYTEIVHGDNTIPYMTFTKPKDSYDSVRRKIVLYERCNQFELLSAIPTCYMWVSPIPKATLDRYGLVQRRCRTADAMYCDKLIFRKGYRLTDIDKMFIEKIYAAKSEVESVKLK